ncbi:MAG: Inositol monophosphatase/fructose-1,6-bisphosphatase family protein [Candidatus Nomurabacteria bacterium GW2011_GWF2_43_8]|uniref:Inositol monophosphatase/fructose-1,6-bisphosphatase family protein n=3 Tax=Candidatus Nomuraibacteriota TaxID=1752729 RepID=A0A0G1IGW2_9BACT|nr:MAG: Inositol monophosphatase/fructose-1,6-bisphosphatase family protein [Candidatus Nomurabacteria bacterium GW2011_GWA2_43_15]KKT19066.1 MAG: Inositol monophosphatase/fructose-1,6-bisphosphatase family protein [Candidatus Nomurabacteria bacterium GW2011_GWB1_43_7]KKT22439.1 MAG: Inositol monophosphatase/fructose-1,6-bisphosphatase family protein [Candidatus Nomurabacteria bacterium GW2011_GWF2_43_8]
MTNKDKKNLIRATHAGGKILRKYFSKTLSLKEKSTLWDFQTEADLGSEKAILKVLKTEFPKYNIHSEEKGKTNNNSEFTIVVDPLDGTNNFVLGIPNFSVSVAILNKKGAIAGVVYQPMLGQTYFAEKNKGATLNNKKINVNKVTNLNNVTVAYNCGYKTRRSHLAKMIGSLVTSEPKRVTFNWSPAYDYCLLASGKIEAVITDRGTEIYDFGAGKLIALEAGAKIIDFKGNKDANYINDEFIISNHEQTNKYILNIIKPLQKTY